MIRFVATGVGIAEMASEALRAGGESTILDDVSRETIAARISRPGTLRFAAYDGPVAIGLVALMPDGKVQAEATVMRFSPADGFPASLQAFLARTMDFLGLRIVRAFSTSEIAWLEAAGFRHDGQLREIWKPQGADESVPMQTLELYSITAAEARLGEMAEDTAKPPPPTNGASTEPSLAEPGSQPEEGANGSL